MAEPNPSNVAPWYLRDMCQALQLDPISGNVFLRTGIQGNVYVTGPVSIPGNVTTVQGTVPWVVSGNVNANVSGNVVVSSMPAITGNVSIISGNSNVSVTGNIAGITSLPAITGNVSITGGNSNVNVIGNIAGIANAVTVNQGTTPWSVTGNLAVTNSVVSIGGLNLDAFGRLRVSEPYTLFDSALNGERRYDFSSATANGGNVTFDYNANVRNLTVTTVNGSSVIRESMYVFPYQPGKSLLVLGSFMLGTTDANRTQRIGFFSTNNGIYFENIGNTISFVIRSSSSGAISNNSVPQNLWNGDKLDGTGPSGYTLDLNATQLMWMDIEWLGVGSVRTGFVIDGQFILCHTFNHANDSTFGTTYMGSAVLPMRYEIFNTGITATSATFQQICCTIISEGGYNQPAATYSAGTGISTVRLTTAGTYYPIVSIRLDSNYLNSYVKVSQVEILSPTVNYYRWAVLKNATLTGATWASPSSTNKVDVDTAATAVSGGTEVQSGYASGRELAYLGGEAFYAQLGRTVTGVSDTFTLVLTATNNNADVCAEMGWQEIL